MWSPCTQIITQNALIRCYNTQENSACQGVQSPSQTPRCGCSKQGQCQWWVTKGAAPDSPKPCSAAPVMERNVHVPFRKSSFLLSRSRMRHSNQPSSSRVSRSTSREAPWVRDTRPVGGGVRVGGQRGTGERRTHTHREREGQHTHSQTGRVSTCRKRAYHAEDTGIQCHKGHSQSHRLYASGHNRAQCEQQL